MDKCQIKGCPYAIQSFRKFPFCNFHYREQESLNDNHCLIKLCESERFEEMSFCEKHCEEFFEKEESELKEQIIKLKDELQKESNSVYRLQNVIQGLIQGMKKEKKPHPSPSPLLTDVISSNGLILCSVDTMKKILNGGES